ncbi:hypothetical protein CBS101457_002303 [Exobasidium rhododendri]|nr:hypothetical protein CBS101457_002303 [Exobasidium rhododendri]
MAPIESTTSSPSRSSSTASSSSHGGLTTSPTTSSTQSLMFPPSASLQASTLGSALGISPSSASSSSSSSSSYTVQPVLPRRGHRSNGKSSHGSAAPLPVWARRPSLPTMPSMGNRVSVASVASFESLPEGESIPHFAVSPLGKSVHGCDGEPDESSTAAKTSTPESSTISSPLKSGVPSSLSPQRDVEADMKKRKNVVMELLTTERIFVASLHLINDNYYQPLAALSRGVPSNKVESLSAAAPVLSRKAIGEIFSNFIDILHLNLELLSRLDDRLSGRSREAPSSRPSSTVSSTLDSPIEGHDVKPWNAETDAIGDLLVPMVPFLKMYSLYVKNFSSALIRIESERKVNDNFARFLKETEKATWGRASNQGGFGFGLGFQAHMLTIVQRIPRYKMLVGDLVQCTPTSHKDHQDLCKAYGVIEKVAESINDNIRQHEMVLVMLGLQRSFLGLSEPLIVPGRSLIKRGPLLKACRKNIQPREFYLFTDCLVYAAPISGSIDAASAAWQAFSRYGTQEATQPLMSPALHQSSPKIYERINATDVKAQHNIDGMRTRQRTMSGPSPYESKRMSMSLEGQQLQFRGKFNLQDCTVVAVDDVVSPEPWLRHCLEIRTPGKSFAVYAETFEVKLQWLSAIRNAREEWVSNRRTLHTEEDSIQAKRDRRRSLQIGGGFVMPSTSRKSSIVFENGSSSHSIAEGEPSKETSAILSQACLNASLTNYLGEACNQALNVASTARPKTLKVLEEYNAPVWVPDSRADRCACCSEMFGIWRRKHHCRLCGQVVCWACSSKYFLIAGYEEGEEDRPARSCDTCYESVFPDTPEHSPNLPILKDKMSVSCTYSDARPISEVSLNTPTTPTSPPSSSPCNVGLMIPYIDDVHPHVLPEADFPLSPSLTTDTSNDTGNSSTDHVLLSAAPYTRRPYNKGGGVPHSKGKLATTQSFQFGDNLLSPQVQAATSGLGTFRLVTPRLTTPEFEEVAHSMMGNRDDNNSSSRSSSSNNNCQSIDGTSPVPPPPSAPSHTSVEGSDYFAGAIPGQSELRPPPAPRLFSARRKPLTAAARLSSFYSGLTSPSMTNLSKS